MKKRFYILILLLTPLLLKAQSGFKTIVPNQPVVAGESFQVQYVIPQTGRIGNFKAPSFKPFRLVSGPNQYTGTINGINSGIPVINYVFTLEAVRPGKFIIPGAVTTVNGKSVQSNDVLIDVISKQQAAKLFDRAAGAGSDYLLRSGEDPYEKIRKNLFLKVLVNRTRCFSGEPVLATFKLYSRLQSKSDIIKNPGFYGFTVYDMVNLADKEIMTEEINGKVFDVHTIRKVQLFPLQPGVFSIDAMEVRNRVEFSRSVVNRKTEQEIAEGMLTGSEEGTVNENAEVYETSISTNPVVIHVNPLPAPNKPPAFNGAVGNFSISSSLIKNKIAKNEEGFFEIIISGQGNFTQLSAPVVNWPEGVEGFEPQVKDKIDETKFPLAGSRTFRYPFIGSGPGQYELPAVGFNFFNPSVGYKTIATAPVQLFVSREEKTNVIKEEKKVSISETNAAASRTAAIIIISLVAAVFIYWIWFRKEAPVASKEEKAILPTVAEVLAPVYTLTNFGDREFYSMLRQSIWNFFNLHFNFSGSDMNKERLLDKIRAGGVGEEDINGINAILQQCEAGMFTNAEMPGEKNELLVKTKEILEKINGQLLL